MTPEQYKDAKAKLGLGHEDLAGVLGVTRRTSLRYANGQTPVPGPVGKLLGLIASGRVTMIEVMGDGTVLERRVTP